MGHPEAARSLAIEREQLRLTEWQDGRGALRVLTALLSAWMTAKLKGPHPSALPHRALPRLIEAGLVHCRALLEFLGLCMTNTRLGNIKKRRGTDIGIENFRNASGNLPKVAPADAVNRYAGGREEAEKALLAIFQVTNRGLAHVTEDLSDNPEHENLIEIASRGIPSLVVSHLYTPLGLPPQTTS